MLDLRRIRHDVDEVKAALARRGGDVSSLDRIVELDARQRQISIERDDLRNRIKTASKAVGTAKRDGDAAAAEVAMAESRSLGDAEKALADEADELAAEIDELMLALPNTPSPDAPDGASEDDNVVLRSHGPDPDSFADHQRVPHWDIGTELGILDFEAAARISGAMFSMYRGWGARLLRACIQLSLDRNADAFEEIRPPTLVRTDTMVGVGELPQFADEAYLIERDDLWAVPTAEVPLTGMGRDQVFDEADLPIRMMAHTSCFRREAGAAGRDTRGLLRSHEFDKTELLAYTATAEQGVAAQEDVLARSESILRDLGLSYRVLDLCTGDLGAKAARTWDIEAYAPGVGAWLEVSSVSWFAEFQGRRSNIRYRPTDRKGTEVCHTVNGSAMGWPRTVACILETHRRPDGRIGVPEVLRSYLGGVESIG